MVGRDCTHHPETITSTGVGTPAEHSKNHQHGASVGRSFISFVLGMDTTSAERVSATPGGTVLLPLGAGTEWDGLITLRLQYLDIGAPAAVDFASPAWGPESEEDVLPSAAGFAPLAADSLYPMASLEAVNDARERLILQVAEEERAGGGPTGTELDEVQGLFVSEWLTEHPISLAGKYPAHIWLHCDSPPMDPGLHNIDALNRVGIVRLREGRPDEALVAWRSMEDEIKARVLKKEAAPLLACAYNNLAGVYYTLRKPAPALQ